MLPTLSAREIQHGAPSSTAPAKSSASSAYMSSPAPTTNVSRGGGAGFFASFESIRGGVDLAITYFAPSASGFHGIGISIYPSLPLIVAVLSACRLMPQVK